MPRTVCWRTGGLLLGMAHVFHLLGNNYGLLCNHRSLLCAAAWLLVMAAERRGCQYKPGRESDRVKNTNKTKNN